MSEPEPVTVEVTALRARIGRLEMASWIERLFIAGLLFHAREAFIESGMVYIAAVIIGFVILFSIIERVRTR